MRTVLVVAAVSAAFLFPSCASHHPLTIAPAPPRARTISDWAKQNVIDADAKGEIVTAEWVRVYKDLLGIYGSKLPVANRPASLEQGITNMGSGRYHVDWTTKIRFVLLKSFDNP